MQAHEVWALAEPWRAGARGSGVSAPGRKGEFRMATAFETALTSAQTAVTGYISTALPVVAAVAVAFLGIKYARRLIGRL